MPFKYEKLEIWMLSLEYVDSMFGLIQQLPDDEPLDLKTNIMRAAISITVDIATTTMIQNPEKVPLLNSALRSLIETTTYQMQCTRRGYISDRGYMDQLKSKAEELADNIISLRESLVP